jgi:hypothetical protein
MVFFASWGKQLEVIGYAGIEKCENCKNYCNFWICEHRSETRVYFMRVASYDKKHLYVCEICEKAWSIDPSAKDEALKRSIGLPSPEQCWEMWDRLMEVADHAAGANKARDNVWEFITNALSNELTKMKQTYEAEQVDYIAERYLSFLADDDRPA